MRNACDHILRMSRMVQIRNVPEEIHRTLKSRAARSGMSLSDFLLAELRKVAERPTADELVQRLAELPAIRTRASSAAAVRAARAERDRDRR